MSRRDAQTLSCAILGVTYKEAPSYIIRNVYNYFTSISSPPFRLSPPPPPPPHHPQSSSFYLFLLLPMTSMFQWLKLLESTINCIGHASMKILSYMEQIGIDTTNNIDANFLKIFNYFDQAVSVFLMSRNNFFRGSYSIISYAVLLRRSFLHLAAVLSFILLVF